MPAYNVENYIEECLSSVLNQKTNYSFHVVVIDDGSTDRTGQIIEQFSENKHISIIHQKNKGFSGARNSGIQVIDSEYLAFVDTDDLMMEGSIEKLMTIAKRNNADIVEGGYITMDEQGRDIHLYRQKEGQLQITSEIRGYPWGKIIKSDYFEKLDFPENYWFEDTIFSHVVYPLIEKNGGCAIGCADPVYKYRINSKGVSYSGLNKPKTLDTLWITLSLQKTRELLGLTQNQAYYESILGMIQLSYRRTKKMTRQIKKDIFVLYSEYLDKELAVFNTERKERELLQMTLRKKIYIIYVVACDLGRIYSYVGRNTR